MAHTADLQPPLGKPGGPCQVVKRIDQNIRSPKLKEDLKQEVEQGRSLSNADAAKIYGIDREPGVGRGPFHTLQITNHAQYRMDFRSVTVKDVQKALSSLLKQLLDWKAKKDPAYEDWMGGIERGEKIEWIDPQTHLLVVFNSLGAGVVNLISTYVKGKPDPVPPKGTCPTAARILARYLGVV